MARRLFFVPKVRNGKADLEGEDARHLRRVLRAEPGQKYELSDNQQLYLAEIDTIGKDIVSFHVIETLQPVQPSLRLTLLTALIKFDRLEWILEKATELGVERILPVDAARSEKGLMDASRKRSERWQRIAREASQQSRRVSAPEILPAVRFTQCLGEAADYRYFLEEGAAPPVLQIAPPDRKASDHVALLLGPEGGWTGEERSQAAAAGWQPVSLGPLVLRAETAAAAALAVIFNIWLAGTGSTPNSLQ